MLVLILLGLVICVSGQDYELNIVHYNDFHARFVETSQSGGICDPAAGPCIGGFARLATKIRESVQKQPNSLVLNGGDTFQGTIWFNLLKWNVTKDFMNMVYHDAHTSQSGGICDPAAGPCIGGFARLATKIRESVQKQPNSLVLNGGDTFQGTIWFNLLKWNVTKDFMNMVYHDAHVLGNHEFDNGVSELVPYLKNLEHQVVTANIIDDEEPSIQGLYKPSIVVEKNGRKIGIIGVIISSTHELASTGKLKFTDEVETVKAEAERLTQQGVDIIVVLSHCGISIDEEIARRAGPHIDIIVGGHSHSLLYNGEPPINSSYVPYGPYPLTVENELKRKVLIVQAGAHTEYLGEIKLTFDDAGHITDWIGNPHYLGPEVKEAPDVMEKINEYLPRINELAKRKVGESKVFLSADCRCGECNLGNLICDAFMHAVMNKATGSNWHYAHFCVMNRGSIRSDIVSGDITFEAMLLSMPFENNVEVFDLRGDHVLEMLEYSVANQPWPGARMLQYSGLRVNFDGSRPLNQRVLNATVRCIECEVPRYEPLDPNKMYKIVSQNFLAEGGDGFTMISKNRGPREIIGIDSDVFMSYLERELPVIRDQDGRIHITNACENEN